MRRTIFTPLRVVYTPRSCRPELFGACQVRQG